MVLVWNLTSSSGCGESSDDENVRVSRQHFCKLSLGTPSSQGGQLLLVFFTATLAREEAHICLFAFVCVCLKAQEDVEAPGHEGEQEEFSPAVFLGAAEADLHLGPSPHLRRVPRQL